MAFLKRYEQFVGAGLFSSGTIKGTGNDGKEPGPELRIIPNRSEMLYDTGDRILETVFGIFTIDIECPAVLHGTVVMRL